VGWIETPGRPDCGPRALCWIVLYSYIRQMNGVKLTDISLLCVSVCVSVHKWQTSEEHQYIQTFRLHRQSGHDPLKIFKRGVATVT